MKQRTLVIVGLAVSLQVGCSSEGRLADFAEQVTHEQAAQNERMAEATQSIAQGVVSNWSKLTPRPAMI